MIESGSSLVVKYLIDAFCNSKRELKWMYQSRLTDDGIPSDFAERA
jgi:hypothetical protein